MQGFGHNHVKKPTTSAAADTPIETATATFPLSLNPELVLLSPLALAVVVGKGLGVPGTVCAVVAEGERASDEGFAVVVKEGEEDAVSEISDRVVFEEEKVLGAIDRVVVV